MCGRYQLRDPKAIGALVFEVFQVVMEVAPRYNVSPSQTMPVITLNEDGGARAGSMRWGLIPFWENSEKPKIAPINARSEDALSKPMFRQSLQKRRCAVPADGFYEWQKADGDAKIPYSIQLRDGHPFFFAGIYENATENRPETYAILTTRPNELMKPIHNRMPVILDAMSAKKWVAGGELTKDRLDDFAVPYSESEMNTFVVSRMVNNPRNDRPEVAEKIVDFPDK